MRTGGLCLAGLGMHQGAQSWAAEGLPGTQAMASQCLRAMLSTGRSPSLCPEAHPLQQTSRREGSNHWNNQFTPPGHHSLRDEGELCSLAAAWGSEGPLV